MAVVVVTGGASGIGRATAALFTERGDEVVVMDRQPPTDSPDWAGYRQVDVCDAADVASAVASVVERYGRIDVMIANAGISLRRPCLDISAQEWRRVLDTNLSGVFFCWQAAARHMMEQRSGGSLLGTSSTNALVGHPHYADYNASKAGMLALCRTLALELAPKIRVNCVCPGYVLTPMQQAEYTPEMLAGVDGRIPLGRHAAPAEIAALFHFLASKAAQYLTGQAIVIDGGETAGGLASTFATIDRRSTGPE